MKERGLTQEKFVHDLENLVGFPTFTGGKEGFDDAFKFIHEQIHKNAFVKDFEVEYKVMTPKGEETRTERVLLASNFDTKRPDVLYLVHVDVVAPTVPNHFTLKVEGDDAFGRGTGDMKFSIPIGYELLNHLIETNSNLKFMLAITTDEERGGFNGAGFLANKYKLKPRVAIVPDGGENFGLVNKSKGVCQIKIVSRGKPGHASEPWKGRNAIEPLSEAINKLVEKYRKNNSKKGWHTTMNVGFISAGKVDGYNLICPEATVGLDFRIPENTNPNEILKEVRAIAKEVDKRNLKVVKGPQGKPAYVDPKEPAFKLFKQVLQKHTGRKLPLKGGYGSSDARHFGEKNIPFLMTKPKSGISHSDNESVNIPSSILFYNALVEFLEEYEKIIKS